MKPELPDPHDIGLVEGFILAHNPPEKILAAFERLTNPAFIVRAGAIRNTADVKPGAVVPVDTSLNSPSNDVEKHEAKPDELPVKKPRKPWSDEARANHKARIAAKLATGWRPGMKNSEVKKESRPDDERLSKAKSDETLGLELHSDLLGKVPADDGKQQPDDTAPAPRPQPRKDTPVDQLIDKHAGYIGRRDDGTLNNDDHGDIVKMRKQGMTDTEICEHYGVTIGYLQKYMNARTAPVGNGVALANAGAARQS